MARIRGYFTTNAPVKGRPVASTPAGEPMVWVTAMGLTVGLTMILFLLGLIFVNGITVFWPKPVAQVEFKEERETRYMGTLVTAGVIQFEQEIDSRDLTGEQRESPDPADRREKQVFVGNRDVFGESFAYFNVGDIESISYPKNMVRAERMEWGDAIFFPLRLQLADGSTIAAEDEAFRKAFSNLVSEVQNRRKEIDRIERRKIGRISQRMNELQLEERFFQRQDSLSPEQEEALERVREEMAELTARFGPLRDEARALRERQQENFLHYQVVTGEERSQPIGNFVHFYYPNDLSLLEKVGLFVSHIVGFVSGYPREANTEGGIFPAIFGTFVMTLLMSVAVMPFGVLAAIYLREYATQSVFVRSVRIAVNNLAGVPSIVFGIFGLGFFVYLMGGTIDELFFSQKLPTPTFGTGGIFWASLTLALMTVPVVIVATEEALSAVSRGVREGALACGASKWQTIRTLVLPASAPGIMTGLVLAMARGAGEVAPLMLVGVVALAPNLPVDSTFPFVHLDRKFMHLGFHIYDLGFQSPDSEAARPMVFATTLVLILLVIVLNLAAIFLRNHLRKKHSSSAF